MPTEPKILKQGKSFHARMRKVWAKEAEGNLSFEHTIALSMRGKKGKRKKGRLDLFIDDDGDNMVAIVEFKRSDWDKMKADRRRPNALRHARQVWAYVEEDKKEVCPGIVYSKAPRKLGRKDQVEEILNDQGLQVVWNNK